MAQMCPNCSYNNADNASTCLQCNATLVGLLGQNTLLEGRYQVTRVLGSGGHGAVYLAEDTRISGRQVAVKESLNTDPQAWDQFQAEVRLMATLNHPGLPKVSDQFIGSLNRQYFVMDYIIGDTLEDLVKHRGSLSETEVVSFTKQLLDILEYLHSRKPPIVHRDVKPHNIKLTPEGSLVLVDFGIAKLHATGQITQSWAKGVGTPGFAPLEQYGRSTNPRSDLYSLGAVMYYLLTSQAPPEAPDLAAGSERLTPPRNLRPDLSLELQRIVFKAMAMNPLDRYQSAAEMRRALLELVDLSFPPPSDFFKKERDEKGPIHIPLRCTLQKAAERIFWEKRQQIVGQIVWRISESTPGKKTIALFGHQGVGTTWVIVKGVSEKLKRQKRPPLVVYLNLMGLKHTEAAEVLRDIFRELKREQGHLSSKLKRVVAKAYREHVLQELQKQGESVKRKMKLDFPVDITIPTLLRIGGRPLEYELEIQRPSDPSSNKDLLLALRHLIQFLIEGKAKVILVVDKVETIELLNLIKELLIRPFVSLNGLTTIVIVDKADFDLWPESEHKFFYPLYVPCIWDFSDRLCEELIEPGPQADNKTLFFLRKHLKFVGEGKPGTIIRKFNNYYFDETYLGEPVWRQMWAHIGRWTGWTKPYLRIDQYQQDELFLTSKLHVKLDEFLNNRQKFLMDSLGSEKRDEAILYICEIAKLMLEQAKREEPVTQKMLDDLTEPHYPGLGKHAVDSLTQNLVDFLTSESLIKPTPEGIDSTGILGQKFLK